MAYALLDVTAHILLELEFYVLFSLTCAARAHH